MALLTALLTASTVFAQDANSRRDDKALDVLKSMSAYTSKLDKLVIRGVAFTDARLDAGLLVSNATEVKLTIDRPGSMYISNFDGVEKKEIYFHKGHLTVFSSQDKFYGRADIPEEIEAAAEYVLEELGIDAPLMDLIYRDVSSHLVGSGNVEDPEVIGARIQSPHPCRRSIRPIHTPSYAT